MQVRVKGTVVLGGEEREVDVILDVEEHRVDRATGKHVFYGVFDSWTAVVDPSTPPSSEDSND